MGELSQFITQKSNSAGVQLWGRLLMSNIHYFSGPTMTVGSGSCDVQQEMWNVTDL